MGRPTLFARPGTARPERGVVVNGRTRDRSARPRGGYAKETGS